MIERDLFVECFQKVFTDENYDILDIISAGFEGETTKVWVYDDEVYLLFKEVDVLISWYKIGHVGRSLCCNNENYLYVDYFKLLIQLKIEIESTRGECKMKCDKDRVYLVLVRSVCDILNMTYKLMFFVNNTGEEKSICCESDMNIPPICATRDWLNARIVDIVMMCEHFIDSAIIDSMLNAKDEQEEVII